MMLKRLRKSRGFRKFKRDRTASAALLIVGVYLLLSLWTITTNIAHNIGESTGAFSLEDKPLLGLLLRDRTADRVGPWHLAVRGAEPGEKARQSKARLINWFVVWWGNLAGALLHFVVFAWQTGLMKTVKIKGDNGLPASGKWDPQNSLEHIETIYYDSQEDFRQDFNDGDFCSRGNFANGNICQVMRAARAKCTANFWTSILRGWGCNTCVWLAIWLQMCATEPISKLFMIWLPIELFISSGFDHLVVNECLIPAGIITGGYYLDHRANFGNAFWFNYIPVTIGSILGAWMLVFPLWTLNKEAWYIAQEKVKNYKTTGIVVEEKPIVFAVDEKPSVEDGKEETA